VSWNVWGVHDSVILKPPGVEVDSKGSKSFQVDRQTSYELQVHHEGDTLHESATAGPEPPEVKEFYSDYRSYAPGEKATVHWEIPNGNEVRIYPGSQKVGNDNQAEVQVGNADPTCVSVLASSRAGVTTREQIRLPTVQIKTFRHIPTDDPLSYKLEWEIENAVRAELDGEDVGTGHSSKQFSSTSDRKTHVLTAYADSGATCNQVLELEPSQIQEFKADRTVDIEGEEVRLTWEVDNAEKVLLDDGIQLRDVTGKKEATVQINKGENRPRLIANGSINRREVVLQVWGIPGSDLIKPVKVPDADLGVGVNEVDVDLDGIPSIRVSVGEAIVPDMRLETGYGGRVEGSSQSLRKMVAEATKGKSEELEIRSMLASEQKSNLQDLIGNLGRYSLRKMVNWASREKQLFSLIPRATWRQIQLIVEKARSLFLSSSD